MKLIKITEEHYIVVDDSEIKVGDWYWNELDMAIRKNNTINHSYHKKITHSTIPKGQMLMEGLKRLSIQEVKELIGEVDVEKRFQDIINSETPQNRDEMLLDATKHGFKYGYNQALEDNKVLINGLKEIVNLCDNTNPSHESIWRIAYSLLPKTEWEVELVDGKLKLK